MVIKSKGNSYIVVFALVCIIIFFLILLFEFDKELIPISSIIFSLLLLILIRYWIATGKTIIMSKTGCTVSFLGYNRVYGWEELKTKYIEYYDNSIEYRTPYTGGVVFSKKEIRKPKWLKIATYSIFVHPVSVFFVYFEVERPESYYKYPKIYEINEIIFREKMKEWGVSIGVKI